MERQRNETQTEAWKELVSRLPGVLNAEFVLENNAIREVHVLSDQSRFPKQIVRDIQSAMAARFQIEVDHRMISVAQIPTMPDSTKKRLLCQRLELSTGRDGLRATVWLEMDGELKKGESMCMLTSYNRSQCIARATVDAINAFVSSSSQFSLIEWKNVPLAGFETVLVGLALTIFGKSEYLVGACRVGDDPNLSVVTATLDAVNRRIQTLSFSTPDSQ